MMFKLLAQDHIINDGKIKDLLGHLASNPMVLFENQANFIGNSLFKVYRLQDATYLNLASESFLELSSFIGIWIPFNPNALK